MVLNLSKMFELFANEISVLKAAEKHLNWNEIIKFVQQQRQAFAAKVVESVDHLVKYVIAQLK
jgi:hypothetical protein